MFTGVCLSTRGGAWSGGCLVPGVVPGGDPLPRTDTAAGGTHPTGMHSCLFINLFYEIFTVAGKGIFRLCQYILCIKQHMKLRDVNKLCKALEKILRTLPAADRLIPLGKPFPKWVPRATTHAPLEQPRMPP